MTSTVRCHGNELGGKAAGYRVMNCDPYSMVSLSPAYRIIAIPALDLLRKAPPKTTTRILVHNNNIIMILYSHSDPQTPPPHSLPCHNITLPALPPSSNPPPTPPPPGNLPTGKPHMTNYGSIPYAKMTTRSNSSLPLSPGSPSIQQCQMP